MDDLHLVGLTEDGGHLVLSAADGEQWRLPLDDRLLAAIRGDLVRLGQLQIELESQLRPAEIQARIRSGQTAEQVAMAAGLPVARVRRYEGPVLAERRHVVQQAQRTPARRRGDGFVPSLSELVEERLAARRIAADVLSWDSARREDGAWSVTVSWPSGSGGNAARARWVFDPRGQLLTPADDEARALTDEEPRPPTRQRREARETQENRPAAGSGPRRLSAVPPRAVRDEGWTDVPLDLGEHAVPDAAEAAAKAEVVPEAEAVPAPEAVPAAEQHVDSEQQAAEAGTGPAAPAAEQRRPASRSAGKGRRATVPSWDDIVFGTRRED